MAKETEQPTEDSDILDRGSDDLDKQLDDAMKDTSFEDTDDTAPSDWDDTGITKPFDEEERDAPVSEADGQARIQKAQDGEETEVIKDGGPETGADDKPAEEAKKDEDSRPDDKAEASEDQTPEDASAETADDKAETEPQSDYDKFFGTLDDGQRALINERYSEADKINTFFEGRKEQLQKLGTTASAAVERLAQLNDFANARPDEYAAWVAQQVNPSDPSLVLVNAAKAIGVELMTAEAWAAKQAAEAPAQQPQQQAQPDQQQEEDDLFADPAVKALKDQVAALSQQIETLTKPPQQAQPEQQQQPVQYDAHRTTAPNVGPDSQSYRIEQEINGFRSAVGADGSLAHPHFDILQGTIADLMDSDKNAGRQIGDLQSYYDRAERMHPDTSQAAIDREVAARVAAQTAENLQKTQTQDKAAATKAQRASQIQGGNDQGVTRQADSDDLGATIYASMAQHGL